MLKMETLTIHLHVTKILKIFDLIFFEFLIKTCHFLVKNLCHTIFVPVQKKGQNLRKKTSTDLYSNMNQFL